MTDHPVGMTIAAQQAFIEKVYWHTVAIVDTKLELIEAGTPNVFTENMGTGSAVSWHGAEMVLTAGHNVAAAQAADIAFFTRPTGQIEWGSSNPRGNRTGPIAERSKLIATSIVRCESLFQEKWIVRNAQFSPDGKIRGYSDTHNCAKELRPCVKQRVQQLDVSQAVKSKGSES